MVRLKEANLHLCFIGCGDFNSNMVRLKALYPSEQSNYYHYFNSNMVRLKVTLLALMAC